MIQLPFPKTRQGWLAAILLTMISFLAYYSLVYPWLFDYYGKIIYTSKQPEGIYVPGLENVKVTLYLPLSLSNSLTSWAYVKVANEGESVVQNIKVSVELVSPDTGTPLTSLPIPSIFSEQVYERSVHFEEVGPHAIVVGRIRLLCDVNANVKVFVNNNEINMSLPQLTIEPGKALLLSIVENILLPPWSNGFIPIIVLVVCWMVEGGRDENRIMVLSKGKSNQLEVHKMIQDLTTKSSDLLNSTDPRSFEEILVWASPILCVAVPLIGFLLILFALYPIVGLIIFIIGWAATSYFVLRKK